MARRTARLRDSKSKSKVDVVVHKESLDYHEGLSANQVKIILAELGLTDKFKQFSEWMYGQTCPVIQRYSRLTGKTIETGGVYEYDLFRWIENQKKGTPLIWD
jgi:hypothetical protein